MAKIGVLLSGCGVFDGAEVHEAVLTLLALSRAGAESVCFAPNVEQMHVVNHLTGQVMEGERRNVLVEAARIARGAIEDAASITAGDFDGLILPGGFGAAKNLCDFAVNGADFSVNPEVSRIVRETHSARKPIGFVCIAPVIAAKLLGKQGVEVTIGNDADTAAAIAACGARHFECGVTEVHLDPIRKVVSTPAYMLGPDIGSVATGIEKLVQSVLEMA